MRQRPGGLAAALLKLFYHVAPVLAKLETLATNDNYAKVHIHFQDDFKKLIKIYLNYHENSVLKFTFR